MGKEPSQIREEIEETRERMGETVDALAYKADVPARVRDRVSQKVEDVKGALGATAYKARASAGKAGQRLNRALPDPDAVVVPARRAMDIVRDNPLGMVMGAVAAGVLIGLVLPATQLEDAQLGELADQAKDQLQETGQDLVDRGKSAAQDVAKTVFEKGGIPATDRPDYAGDSGYAARDIKLPTA